MPQIHLLSQETIDKIAAGEVIERPSSVVKELVENAIDAQATAITVEIKEGGISLIRITDNGCGIPADQVKIAFLRHSTSKISSALDLMNVSSLGFRGRHYRVFPQYPAWSLSQRLPTSCAESGIRLKAPRRSGWRRSVRRTERRFW